MIDPAESLKYCLRRLGLAAEELNRVVNEGLLPWSDEAEELLQAVEDLMERMRGS